MNNKENLAARLKCKISGYANSVAAKIWLEQNKERIQALFSDVHLRDFVFEPIKGVFIVQGEDDDSEIRAAITRVAVANAVMAGLPGKMGIGVMVSMALEGWMAYVIAHRVGIRIESTSDIWKYFSLLAGIGLTIFEGIRWIIGFWLSLPSIVPGMNPMIFAELLVTNLVGVVFWIGFKEAKSHGSFTIPVRALKGIWRESRSLYDYQYNILKQNLSPRNLRLMAMRLRDWLTGEIPLDKRTIRGDIFPTITMAWLLAGEYQKLDGPLGKEFIGAIRDRFPDLAQATTEQIAEHMTRYDADELAGVINLIKGKLFERLVAHHENVNSDEWVTHLHEDESYPGSDIIFTNEKSGEVIEISLKATDNPAYIEHALLRYPEFPIMTTDEVAEYFEGNDSVIASGFTNEEVTRVTKDNFDEMLDRLAPTEAIEVASGGVAAGTIAALWPFVIGYLRNRITHEQLEMAFTRVLGNSGVRLASRVSYALLLGPLFAWYLLARSVMGLTVTAANPANSTLRLSYHISQKYSQMPQPIPL